MKTIIPPTMEKTIPKTISVKKGCKMAYPAIPPMGSVNPESKAQPNAFHLDSVA